MVSKMSKSDLLARSETINKLDKEGKLPSINLIQAEINRLKAKVGRLESIIDDLEMAKRAIEKVNGRLSKEGENAKI